MTYNPHHEVLVTQNLINSSDINPSNDFMWKVVFCCLVIKTILILYLFVWLTIDIIKDYRKSKKSISNKQSFSDISARDYTNFNSDKKLTQ